MVKVWSVSRFIIKYPLESNLQFSKSWSSCAWTFLWVVVLTFQRASLLDWTSCRDALQNFCSRETKHLMAGRKFAEFGLDPLECKSLEMEIARTPESIKTWSCFSTKGLIKAAEQRQVVPNLPWIFPPPVLFSLKPFWVRFIPPGVMG